jgi:SPP1 gp7 family putative phage head morphogenesis protein
MPNVLRGDPTRTGGIRRKFEADIRRRMAKLRSKIWDLIVKQDAFGLKGTTPAADTVAKLLGNTRWQFLTTSEKQEQFQTWLQGEIDSGMLSTNVAGEPWTAKYIDSSYRQATVRSYVDSNTKRFAGEFDVLQQSQADFLIEAFAQPERLSKLKVLQTRAFEQLKGLTGDMASQINRELANGLGAGLSPRDIARNMNKRIKGLTKRRALMIARTEVVHAHAEGQLDTFEDLGVKEVGVMAEWSTAGDDRVCDRCGPMEGQILKIKEARMLIPRHPNCRCAWVPSTVDTKQGNEASTKATIESAIKKSVKAEFGKKVPTAKAFERSRWPGADKKISRTRVVRRKRSTDPPQPKPKKKKKTKPKKVASPKKKSFFPDTPKPKPQTVAPSLETKLATNEELNALVDTATKTSDEGFEKLGSAVLERDAVKKEIEVLRTRIQNATDIARRTEDSDALYEQIDEMWDSMNDAVERLNASHDKVSALKATANDKVHKVIGLSDDERLRFTPSIDLDASGEFRKRATAAKDFVHSVVRKRGTDRRERIAYVQAKQAESGTRAYYMPAGGDGPFPYINVGQFDDVRVFVHEFGHHLENSLENAGALAREFRDYRIKKAGTKDVAMRKQFPDRNYSWDEVGNPDDWEKTFGDSAYYVGKTYASGDTEVISMGIEKLYAAPAEFAQKDPEFFKFIIGVMRGLL